MRLTTPTLALLSTTILITSATPIEVRTTQTPFSLMISEKNSIPKGPLQANNGSFWLGKAPSISCPSAERKKHECPKGNSTFFLGSTSGNGTVMLDVEVAGGQKVYIAPNGLLTYTAPHSSIETSEKMKTATEMVVKNRDDVFNTTYQYWLCNSEKEKEQWRVWLEYTDAKGEKVLNGRRDNGTCTEVGLVVHDSRKTVREEMVWMFEY